MRTIINWCLDRRLFVLTLVLGFCVAGLVALNSVSIDAVPDITNVQVMVNVKTGSLSPEQIERLVTYPIEMELNGIPGATESRSLSKYGLSQIIVVFENSTDIFWARSQIFERLSSVSLPNGVKAELAPITTGLGEVVMYTLSVKPGSPTSNLAEQDQLIQLRELQERIIRPALRRVEDVADVDTNGGYKKEIHINVFPEKLKSKGLSITELAKQLDNLGQNAGGGYIQENGNQIIVGVIDEVNHLDQINRLPLKVDFQGKQIRMSDVAEVRIESRLRVGAATTQGRETVLGTVLMRSGANSRRVAIETVDKLKSLVLPSDVKVDLVYTRSFLVDTTIHTVSKSLLEGAALVIVILILLVGDLRSAILVASVIPISLLGAFIGMKITGVSANLMSLGAIDFGLIVDGAVVMVENIVRRSGDPEISNSGRKKFFLESSLEVIRPVLFGVIIIMLVYVPIIFLSGIEGKMFRPMALTVLFALISSLIMTVTFIPAAASLMLKVDAHHKTPWIFAKLESFYASILPLAFKKRLIMFGATLLILATSVWVLTSRIGSDFIPQLDEGDLVIGLVRSASQGVTESVSQQKKAERIILTYPEVETVFSRLGTPESATDPMSVNFADTFVILKKNRSEWPVRDSVQRSFSKSELFDAIKNDLEKQLVPQDISRTQPIEMRFNEILEGSRADVTLRFFGPDLNVLSDLINQSKQILEGLPGLQDAQFDSLTALTKSKVLDVKPDLTKLTQNSVSLSNLKDGFAIALAGTRVGTYYDYDKAIPVVLHLDESLRESEKEIGRLPIETLHNGVVALEEVASLVPSERVTTIARSWGERYSALSLFVKGRDIDSFVAEAKIRIETQVKMPPGYRTYWGGQFRNMAEARSRFAILIPLTLFFILLMLYQNFQSWREAMIVFSAVPLAMVGGVFSLWLRGFSLTVPAIIGFVALAGIAVLNAVVLITFISQLRKEGMDLKGACMEGAKIRLRPVLMTALVAAFGFIPMALNTGLGAEVQRPLATVVIGGIISATLLTLVIMPLIYYSFAGRRLNK